jgi:hypothetical protein
VKGKSGEKEITNVEKQYPSPPKKIENNSENIEIWLELEVPNKALKSYLGFVWVCDLKIAILKCVIWKNDY